MKRGENNEAGEGIAVKVGKGKDGIRSRHLGFRMEQIIVLKYACNSINNLLWT